MKKFRFDQTIFEDLRTYSLVSVINELFSIMSSEIDNGNVVVIERRYSNAQSEEVVSINTQKELEQFRKSLQI